MSRKHYIAVAAMLKLNKPGKEFDLDALCAWQNIVHGLADLFKADNAAFDRSRFLAAAGLE
jgi:hypothetical protein